MVSNMFSVLEGNLAALRFLLLILSEATSESHGGMEKLCVVLRFGRDMQ